TTLCTGNENCVTCPCGVTRSTWLLPGSVNQRFPSGPATIWADPSHENVSALCPGIGNAVTVESRHRPSSRSHDLLAAQVKAASKTPRVLGRRTDRRDITGSL